MQKDHINKTRINKIFYNLKIKEPLKNRQFFLDTLKKKDLVCRHI